MIKTTTTNNSFMVDHHFLDTAQSRLVTTTTPIPSKPRSSLPNQPPCQSPSQTPSQTPCQPLQPPSQFPRQQSPNQSPNQSPDHLSHTPSQSLSYSPEIIQKGSYGNSELSTKPNSTKKTLEPNISQEGLSHTLLGGAIAGAVVIVAIVIIIVIVSHILIMLRMSRSSNRKEAHTAPSDSIYTSSPLSMEVGVGKESINRSRDGKKRLV